MRGGRGGRWSRVRGYNWRMYFWGLELVKWWWGGKGECIFGD